MKIREWCSTWATLLWYFSSGGSTNYHYHSSIAHVEHHLRIFTFLRELFLSARDFLSSHGPCSLYITIIKILKEFDFAFYDLGMSAGTARSKTTDENMNVEQVDFLHIILYPAMYS